MLKVGLSCVGLAAVMLLANVGTARSDVIVSNLNATVAGTGTIYASGPPQAYAQEFTTGSQSLLLTNIVAALGDASGSFTASAELVTSSGGLPSTTVVTSLAAPSIPTTAPTDVTFTPNSSVTLSANTDYWLILAATGTGSYQWYYTNMLEAALPNYAVSNNGGTSWIIGSPPGPFLIGVDGAPAAAVPEPSAAADGLLGLAALALIVRRRSGRGRAGQVTS